MQTEAVNLFPLIGPLGVVGWVIAIALLALYVHLWRSSGPRALRTLNRQLEEASKLIGQLQEENMGLHNRNDFLRTELNKVNQALVDQRHQMVLLAKANDELRNTVGRLSLQLQAADEKSANFYQRVVRLEALIDLRDETGTV